MLQASVPCFLANKGGASNNQTGITDAAWNPCTFTNEIFDIGSYYDNSSNSRWTPPAGLIRIGASFHATGTIASGNVAYIGIYKNVATVLATSFYACVGGATVGGIPATIEDKANGTDYYWVQVYVDVTSGTATVIDDVTLTYFWGYWISE